MGGIAPHSSVADDGRRVKLEQLGRARHLHPITPNRNPGRRSGSHEPSRAGSGVLGRRCRRDPATRRSRRRAGLTLRASGGRAPVGLGTSRAQANAPPQGRQRGAKTGLPPWPRKRPPPLPPVGRHPPGSGRLATGDGRRRGTTSPGRVAVPHGGRPPAKAPRAEQLQHAERVLDTPRGIDLGEVSIGLVTASRIEPILERGDGRIAGNRTSNRSSRSSASARRPDRAASWISARSCARSGVGGFPGATATGRRSSTSTSRSTAAAVRRATPIQSPVTRSARSTIPAAATRQATLDAQPASPKDRTVAAASKIARAGTGPEACPSRAASTARDAPRSNPRARRPQPRKAPERSKARAVA